MVWYSIIQWSFSRTQFSSSFLNSQEPFQNKEIKVQYYMSLYQRCQGTKGAKGVRGQKFSRVPGFKKVPRAPGSKSQKVYSGAGFCQELISDRACLLKKVHLVIFLFGDNINLTRIFDHFITFLLPKDYNLFL